MSSKFQPLTDFLASAPAGDVTLSFSQIESIVGPLPKSARDYDAYWNESPTHTITHAWLRAGFVRKSVSRAAGVLKLKKAATEAAALRKRHGVSVAD